MDRNYVNSVNGLRDGTLNTMLVLQGPGTTPAQYNASQVLSFLGVSTGFVESAATYTALLATTSTQVNVTHADYGGKFYISADQSSPALLGVRVRRTDLTYMDRAWDRKHYLLDWADLTTWSGDAGPGIQAVLNAFDGNVVVIGKHGKVYDVRTRCNTSGIDVHLRDLSVRRMDAKHSLTTIARNSGATSFTVADGTQFAIGDVVTINDSLSVNAASTASEIRTITNIAGNVVTLSGGLSRSTGTAQWPIGSVLFTAQYGMFLFDADANEVTLENCTFDGNSDNNLYTCYWIFNVTISSRTRWGIVNKCEFKNTPCENFFTEGNWTFTDCIGNNMYGSFSHGSDPGGITPAVHRYHNCNVDGVCKIGQIATISTNDHNEGAITWSANVSKVHISGCNFSNGYQQCFGSIGGDDADVCISDSVFHTFTSISVMIVGGNTSTSKIRIVNCDFTNCGDILMSATSAGQGKNFASIKILDCSFRGNTRIWANNQTDIILSNLRFIYDGTAFNSALLSISAIFTNNCAIQLVRCDRLKMDNIYIEAPKTYTAELEYGIGMFFATNGGLLREDAAGVATTFYYAQNIDIHNVQIANCRYGFAMDNTLNRSWVSGVQGVRISGLTVYGPPDLTHTPDLTNAVGIWLAPGTIATDLIVYSMTSSNTTWQPYILCGIHSTSIATNRGCMVDGLWLIGPSNRGLIIGGTAANRANYNVIVRNAYTSNGTHTNVDAARNSVSVTTIDSTLLPALTSPVAQQFYARNENTGVY